MGARDATAHGMTNHERCAELHLSLVSVGHGLRKCFDRTLRKEIRELLWEEYVAGRLPCVGYHWLCRFYGQTMGGVRLPGDVGGERHWISILRGVLQGFGAACRVRKMVMQRATQRLRVDYEGSSVSLDLSVYADDTSEYLTSPIPGDLAGIARGTAGEWDAALAPAGYVRNRDKGGGLFAARGPGQKAAYEAVRFGGWTTGVLKKQVKRLGTLFTTCLSLVPELAARAPACRSAWGRFSRVLHERAFPFSWRSEVYAGGVACHLWQNLEALAPSATGIQRLTDEQAQLGRSVIGKEPYHRGRDDPGMTREEIFARLGVGEGPEILRARRLVWIQNHVRLEHTRGPGPSLLLAGMLGLIPEDLGGPGCRLPYRTDGLGEQGSSRLLLALDRDLRHVGLPMIGDDGGWKGPLRIADRQHLRLAGQNPSQVGNSSGDLPFPAVSATKRGPTHQRARQFRRCLLEEGYLAGSDAAVVEEAPVSQPLPSEIPHILV